jgi:hypothetical protein
MKWNSLNFFLVWDSSEGKETQLVFRMDTIKKLKHIHETIHHHTKTHLASWEMINSMDLVQMALMMIGYHDYHGLSIIQLWELLFQQ